MLDTVDGKYTKEQLKEMIETLEDAKDTIENTIDTMENKISAMDSNMSFKDYLNQQLNTQTEEKLKPKPLPKKATTNQEKPQKNLVKRKELIYNIDDMFNEVRKTIIAQDEPLKRLISEIVRKDMNPILKRQGIMLSGATGTGKTEMMRQLGIYLEKNIGKKLYIVDSSQLTKEGYVGKDIEKVFYELLLECKRDIKKAENSILYIDEIDKKASQNNDDPAGKGVLNMFLKLIEGTVFDAAPNNKSTSQNNNILNNMNFYKSYKIQISQLNKNNDRQKLFNFDESSFNYHSKDNNDKAKFNYNFKNGQKMLQKNISNLTEPKFLYNSLNKKISDMKGKYLKLKIIICII